MPIIENLSIEPRIKMSNVATAQVSVGRYTYGNPLCMVWTAEERIEIGSFCSIAERVVIFGGGEHRTDWISTYPFAEVFDIPEKRIVGHPASKGTTRIGNDVWLGFQSTILSGVEIGHGAVIGANAVVSRDVPPYSIVVGNPGRVVRYRFDLSVISDLVQIAWWDWPIGKILQHADLLSTHDIASVIPELKRVAASLKE
jgi:chloramphenicol O-acetyltransferase type B